MSEQEEWDVIVIGGGAAGYYGAITAGQQGWGALRVLILERSRKVLQKVKISGGGRCNVTHDTDDPRWMATNYPRGEKPLIGPLHRFGPRDTARWFEGRGVALKAEADGRIFPTTDDSQTIIDCLQGAATEAGVALRTRVGVEAVVNRASDDGPGFELVCTDGSHLHARRILLATGGTRAGTGASLARTLGHTLQPPVPSLFTFNIADPRLEGLMGLTVEDVSVKVVETGLESRGPTVITHWGLSGPAVLKLSAWGARELHGRDYDFSLEVDWLPGIDAADRLQGLSQDGAWGRRQVATRSPFDPLPKRLWQSLVEGAGLARERTWAQLSKEEQQRLTAQLKEARFAVTDKSLNKDEFVTCGGVSLDEVDMRTMESKRCPGAYFAGELLDVDGVTGGFNFQNAWTTGHLAGTAMAASLGDGA